VGSLQELSSSAILAILIASAIAVLDGVASEAAILVPLLAIPPVIAAANTSVPETVIVGAFCVLMALLSGLWNQDVAEAQYFVRLLTVCAGAVAAVWVAGLRVNLKREQEGAELMAEMGGLMEGTLGVTDRAKRVTDLAVPTLGDVAMIDVLTSDGTITRLAASSGSSKVADLFIKLRDKVPIPPDGPHPVAEVIRTGEAQFLGPLTDEQIEEITTRESEREMLRKHRFKSCLLLPLRARDSVIGALTLWIMLPPNAFDHTARRIAERLAQRTALALDNARLHAEQAHIATVLQGSLLPRSLPEIPGFTIATRFQAAGEAYAVGGDFYDVFRTGSQNWSIVIGDVCGKGPEAAALTSLARYTIRTASSPETPPSEVLRTLHDSISSEESDLRFCTAALLRFEPSPNGRRASGITLALGGHPPPLALRKSGKVDVLGEPGTLLGALPDPDVTDAVERLADGDALVLYTDGVLDVGDPALADDPGWLANQLEKLAGKSPEKIADGLVAAAAKRHGGEPRDDVAVLVLQRS
jgi:serine phosphatase RsbU (regulator of sigma subunit)